MDFRRVLFRSRTVVFDLFQDLDGFSLDDYKPFSDISSSMARLLHFFQGASLDQGKSFQKLNAETYILVGNGASRARFTTNRDAATSHEIGRASCWERRCQSM